MVSCSAFRCGTQPTRLNKRAPAVGVTYDANDVDVAPFEIAERPECSELDGSGYFPSLCFR